MQFYTFNILHKHHNYIKQMLKKQSDNLSFSFPLLFYNS